jgi:acetylornithine aminotransferase
VNTPTTRTGAVAPHALLERLASRFARGARGSSFASDEAYSELWFSEPPPPPSALELPDLTNVLVLNTLSKRSSMTGFRSGFAAGDPELIAALATFRPNVGTAPQEFVQRASTCAWGDEEHVVRMPRRTRASVPAPRRPRRKGPPRRRRPATMYLWIAVPPARRPEEHAARLLEPACS